MLRVTALAVIGNHEFNAAALATPDPNAPGYLRTHSEKNVHQHAAFLGAYQPGSADYEDTIAWFRALELWLDLGDIRVVHACWDPEAISYLARSLDNDNRITDPLLVDVCVNGSRAYESVETILKGKEIPLPSGSSFYDKDGNHRQHIRIRWWDASVKSHREAFFGPESALTDIPEDPIDQDHLVV